jgi:hypothetical protein
MKPKKSTFLSFQKHLTIEHKLVREKDQGSLIESIEISPGKTLKINQGQIKQQKE